MRAGLIMSLLKFGAIAWESHLNLTFGHVEPSIIASLAPILGYLKYLDYTLNKIKYRASFPAYNTISLICKFGNN